YKPQFLKENNALVNLSLEVLAQESIEQYEKEERSLLAKRATVEQERLEHLLHCMKNDNISTPAKIKQLKRGLFDLVGDVNFKKSKNMGELLSNAIDFIVRNYKNENPFIIK